MKLQFIFFFSLILTNCQTQTIEQKLLVEGDNMLITIKQKKFKEINNGQGRKHSEGDLHYLNYLANFLDTMKDKNKLIGEVKMLDKPLYEVLYSYKKDSTSSKNEIVSFTFVTDENNEHIQIRFHVTPIVKDNWIEELIISDSTRNNLLKSLEDWLNLESKKTQYKPK